jgi:hypothetical protein
MTQASYDETPSVEIVSHFISLHKESVHCSARAKAKVVESCNQKVRLFPTHEYLGRFFLDFTSKTNFKEHVITLL